MLKKLGPKKIVIRYCKEAFRKMVTRHELSFVLQTEMCRGGYPPHCGDDITSIQRENEVYVICLKCSPDVEVFKIKTGLL